MENEIGLVYKIASHPDYIGEYGIPLVKMWEIFYECGKDIDKTVEQLNGYYITPKIQNYVLKRYRRQQIKKAVEIIRYKLKSGIYLHCIVVARTLYWIGTIESNDYEFLCHIIENKMREEAGNNEK